MGLCTINAYLQGASLVVASLAGLAHDLDMQPGVVEPIAGSLPRHCHAGVHVASHCFLASVDLSCHLLACHLSTAGARKKSLNGSFKMCRQFAPPLCMCLHASPAISCLVEFPAGIRWGTVVEVQRYRCCQVIHKSIQMKHGNLCEPRLSQCSLHLAQH